MKFKIIKFIFLMTLLGIFTSTTALAVQRLVLNTSYSAPITSPKKNGFLDLLYQELATRTGIQIEIQELPAERALGNANEGIDDGDVCRIAGLEKTYPNLVMVPERVMRIQMGVFTRGENFTVNGPESLKPYDVGIVTGWKILERTIVDTRSRVTVSTAEQLFAMLNDKRIDVGVIERMQGLRSIKRMGFKDIKELQPAFLELDWYLYLNKKHAALSPILAAELKKMKADGTSQRLHETVLNRYK